ncbi:hypothetical protein [Butyricimonas virosa]
MDKIVEQRFIEKVLRHQGDRLLRNQGRALYAKARFRSGQLDRGRSVSVSGDDNLNGELVFRHVDYERFLDMKRMVKMKNGKTRRKSGCKIHNRFTYGHFLAIAKQLSVGFTDSVKEKIREELKAE